MRDTRRAREIAVVAIAAAAAAVFGEYYLKRPLKRKFKVGR